MKGVPCPRIHAQTTCIPPPPYDSSEESSAPYHEDTKDQMTPEAEESKKIDHVNNMEVPADVNADKDHFQDIDRQDTLREKLGNELREASWTEGNSGQPLTKLKRLTKNVKPAHEEFWYSQERDTFIRLSEAAKKLEASQPEAKKDAALQNSQMKDQVSPIDGCVSCHQSVGHHLLK